MRIAELFKEKKTVLSFEIFPPKRNDPVETIYETIDALKDLSPDFISVTYGAGGSTRGHTVEIASHIQQNCGINALPHLTCCTSTRREVEEVLGQLEEAGVKNILALRGDLPKEADAFPLTGQYQVARELIEHLNVRGGFCLGAACYPEKHQEALSRNSDIKHLKAKVDAGAEFLISQLFFDNDLFYDFMERVDLLDIKVPITAGIMPMLNRKQIARTVELSGCTLPKKFLRIMERYEHDPVAFREAGMAYAIEQIIDLMSWGISGIHLYTMNKPDSARIIVESISAIRHSLNR